MRKLSRFFLCSVFLLLPHTALSYTGQDVISDFGRKDDYANWSVHFAQGSLATISQVTVGAIQVAKFPLQMNSWATESPSVSWQAPKRYWFSEPSRLELEIYPQAWSGELTILVSNSRGWIGAYVLENLQAEWQRIALPLPEDLIEDAVTGITFWPGAFAKRDFNCSFYLSELKLVDPAHETEGAIVAANLLPKWQIRPGSKTLAAGERISADGTDAEGAPFFKFSNNGSLISGGKARFTDLGASFTYAVNVKEIIDAEVAIQVGNEYKVELSSDNIHWTPLFVCPGPFTKGQNDGGAVRTLTASLGQYLGETEEIYLRFSDADPADGWGCYLVSVEFTKVRQK